MRLLIIICTLFVSLPAFSQQNDRTFTLKEAGWTFTLPEYFKRHDSAQIAATNQRGRHMIDSVNKINIQPGDGKTLFAASTVTKNYFEVYIERYNKIEPADYIRISQNARNVEYKTFASMPGAEVDSISSTKDIDGRTFAMFTITVSRGQKPVFTSVELTNLNKNVGITISYIYQTLYIKEELETMLANSKFVR